MQFLPLEMYGLKVYAGFWRRLVAAVLDSLVSFLLFGLLYLAYVNSTASITWLVLAALVYNLSYAVYTTFFHYRFGATLGKLATGIKVTQPDGSPITLGQAFLRSIVEIAFAVTYIALDFQAFSRMNTSEFIALPQQYGIRSDYIYSYTPNWYELISLIYFLWIISELIVLLFNKRKRALHDLIAGTVVIDKEFSKEKLLQWLGQV